MLGCQPLRAECLSENAFAVDSTLRAISESAMRTRLTENLRVTAGDGQGLRRTRESYVEVVQTLR